MMIATFLERRSWNQPAKTASVAAVVAAVVLAMGPAQAQVTWDSSFSTSGPQDGAGTWSTLASGTNWWNGTTNVAWPSGNIATFGAGGTAGTVTVSGSVNAGGLTFGSLASGTYTLSSGTIGLTTGGTISAATTFTLNSTLSGSNITLLWTTGTGVIGSVGSTLNALSGTFAVRVGHAGYRQQRDVGGTDRHVFQQPRALGIRKPGEPPWSHADRRQLYSDRIGDARRRYDDLG
jgi:hypothetical protein